MLTGIPGWHKRINRNFKSVGRHVQLNDQINLDPNRDAVGIMHNAAKKAVLGRQGQEKVAREISTLENLLTLGKGNFITDGSSQNQTAQGLSSSASALPQHDAGHCTMYFTLFLFKTM